MNPTLAPLVHVWGYSTPTVSPSELVEQFAAETKRVLDGYKALLVGPEDCLASPSHRRVSVVIPLNVILFDQLMNGCNGYRAHYAVSEEMGEEFNRRLVNSVVPLLIQAAHLYEDKFDKLFCETSLRGPHTKLWFSTEVSDKSADSWLINLSEDIIFPRWVDYWRDCYKPWKGLLAPIPESPEVLLNGSFVNDQGEYFDQKPGRSYDLYEHGWT